MQMTGYDRGEIIGRNCRFLQGEDRGQDARWILKDAVQKGSSVSVELRNYRKDGSLFWNELYMSPVKNSSGVITHFIGVQNDITRRKNAEERLKATQDNFKAELEKRTRKLSESEEYLKSILATIRESIVVLDADLKVLSVNHFFLKTFQVSEAET